MPFTQEGQMNFNNAKFETSYGVSAQLPPAENIEIAFAGRSNVGKSSLINMLVRRKGLAKTSQTPGKTLLINHFSINDGEWYLVDLPGYGYAQRGKAQRDQLQKLIEGYVLDRRQLTNLFVLIDVRHEPQKIDMEFMDWLGEHGVPFSIIFTKADKLSNAAVERNVEAYKNELKLSWEELPQIFITSSEKPRGRDEVLDYIDSINRELKSECKSE